MYKVRVLRVCLSQVLFNPRAHDKTAARLDLIECVYLKIVILAWLVGLVSAGGGGGYHAVGPYGGGGGGGGFPVGGGGGGIVGPIGGGGGGVGYVTVSFA